MKPMSFAVAASAVLLTGCAATQGNPSATMSSSAGAASPAPAPQTAAISMPDGPGRDWTKVDTNGDGYVSPEEMEAWLKANPGPLAKR